MAMDNELRKILLREQDLRFVTDTLTQYLGKKAEDRKYYADQAHEERMAKKETETKPLEREKFYYDVAPESQWSPEFKKYQEDNKLNVSGGESGKLFDITDTQSEQYQAWPELTLRSKPSDSQTTASTKLHKWNNPITGERVVGNLDKFNLFNAENPDTPITEIFTISSEPTAKDADKLKTGDLVVFVPTKNVKIDGRTYKPGEQALIPVGKAYTHQQNGSGDIQLTKTDKKSLGWSEKEEIQFTEYKRMRAHIYKELGVVVDPLNPLSVSNTRAQLLKKYPAKTYEDILKDIVFPDNEEYKRHQGFEKKFGHLWVVDDAPPASTGKQFQWAK